MIGELHRMISHEGTILHRIEEMAQRYPKRSAIIFLGQRFTYRELWDLLQRLADAASGLGIEKDERALLYLPNCPQWVVTYLGLQLAEAVPVPVSHIYTPHELRYLIQNAGARVVFCSDTNFGYVREVAPQTGVTAIVVTRVSDLLPWWKRWLGVALNRVPTGTVQRDSGVHDFSAILRRKPTRRHAPTAHAGGQLAHILYTGGTTGFPKGVPHAHAELLSGIIGLREMYRRALGEAGHVVIVGLPLFHMFTQDMLWALALHLGSAAEILPIPGADAVLAAIERHRATLLVGVPALYRRLLDNQRLGMYDIGSLRYCWSAGDVLPAETAAAWRRHTGLPIHQVYGSTETVCISASALDHEPHPHQVGQIIPTRDVRVVDPESMMPVAAGAEGELLVGSPYSYEDAGYWRNVEETDRTYVTIDGRTWCRTGDYVRLGHDGALEFVDRRADLIKHKGFRVSASRVESVLHDHPAVLAAAVVGSPDRVAGENVKAFVILDRDARGVTAFDLLQHCRERLLPYEVPDYVEFRDMLPKSKVGKLLRRELKEEEHRRAGGV